MDIQSPVPVVARLHINSSAKRAILMMFERQILPQQTIYRWKGNLTPSRIHFRFLKNILISRRDSPMVPEWVSEKIANF